ncbi:ABC transporter ATP-binding protein [Streptomyces longispororuber]|uniref:ABC transporter ATP-binding protein n=1 Tax=Streptomyces longispororuber TaxID=68230 RepID=UPI00210DBE88|nr:ABC transporter ATP-binding protein [Streptomyces longispororuber]MCQ4209537.1 ABC transporter ATP-binding protein [Streptomyces longispororuber]
MSTRAAPILEIEDLHTCFELDDGTVRAVSGVDLTIGRGEVLAVVGESGCGKSVMARSVLRLIDKPGRITGGSIRVHDADRVVDMVTAPGPELRSVRGRKVAMVFQEPIASMSPMHTLGNQIGESLVLHGRATKAEARTRVVDLLRRVGIAAPERRADEYPFQMSGGMLQRAMIAMALSCGPDLLIADEPTTALDVTTQAQILDLLRELQRDTGMAVMLITHDLGVAAQMADRIAVMYLGSVVETGTTDTVLRSPRHPYTRALLRSVPKLGSGGRERLRPVRGMVPGPYARPPGCPFHPRCEEFMAGRCDSTVPGRVPAPLPAPAAGTDGTVSCLRYEDVRDDEGKAAS